MEKAILYNAVLSGANLINAKLNGAELAGAALDFTNLQGTVFTGTQLNGVNLTNAAISVDILKTKSVGVFLFGLPVTKPEYSKVLKELGEEPVLLVKNADIAQYLGYFNTCNMVELAAKITTIRDTFSAAAKMEVTETGKGWRITDPTPKKGEATNYTIWDGFDKRGTRGIYMQPTLVELTKLLNDNASIRLRYQATALKNTTYAGCWDIDNDTFNKDNLQLGYMKLQVIKEDDNSLSFYGSNLRIQQLNEKGNLEIIMRSYKSTVLAKKGETTQDCKPDGEGSIFGPDTICPNTLKFSTNQSDPRPWIEMLRSPKLPKPPDCVPTPFSGCG